MRLPAGHRPSSVLTGGWVVAAPQPRSGEERRHTAGWQAVRS